MDILMEQVAALIRERKSKEQKQLEIFNKLMRNKIEAKKKIALDKRKEQLVKRKMLDFFPQSQKVSLQFN